MDDDVASRGGTGFADASLIEEALAGDERVREELVESVRPRVLAWCKHLLHDPDDADDCTQDILVNVWQHVDELHDPRAFSAWLYRITLNVCLRWKAPRKEGIPLEKVERRMQQGGHPADEEIEAREELESLLAPLDDQDKKVLDLRFNQGCSGRELGEELHISEGAARVRVHDILARLRRLLSKGGSNAI